MTYNELIQYLSVSKSWLGEEARQALGQRNVWEQSIRH